MYITILHLYYRNFRAKKITEWKLNVSLKMTSLYKVQLS